MIELVLLIGSLAYLYTQTSAASASPNESVISAAPPNGPGGPGSVRGGIDESLVEQRDVPAVQLDPRLPLQWMRKLGVNEQLYASLDADKLDNWARTRYLRDENVYKSWVPQYGRGSNGRRAAMVKPQTMRNPRVEVALMDAPRSTMMAEPVF